MKKPSVVVPLKDKKAILRMIQRARRSAEVLEANARRGECTLRRLEQSRREAALQGAHLLSQKASV